MTPHEELLNMTIGESITAFAREAGLDVTQKRSKLTLSKVVAERKAFLSKTKLTYAASIDIDDEARTVGFAERLTESGSGMGSDTGVGFKTESYRTGSKTREGNIEQQSTLFGARYDYQFDYAPIRGGIEAIATAAGYRFESRLLGR
jgi:hypothetical protein